MVAHAHVLALALLAATLTLVRACQMVNGFICVPDQAQCRRMGGKCSMAGGRCQCVPEYSFYGYSSSSGFGGAAYGYNPNPGSPYGMARRAPPPEVEPAQPYVNPLGEANIEQQTKLMVNFARMYNMMS